MEKKINSSPNMEELKAKYGKVYSITIDIDEDDSSTVTKQYCFKRPSAISYDRFVKTASNSPTKASKQFCLDNLVEEHQVAFEQDVEEYPALVMTITDKLFSLLGLSKDVSLKKE